jgi:ATP-dependent helicase HrpB
MSLPIENILPQLKEKLAQHQVLVLEAPPGAGKTTRVPLALLEADWLNGRKILMLEPRRLAARSAAEFMAAQRHERVGQCVGYSIRYENRTSAQTRIEVITEGILTRRLQSDPELSGVGLVIFDEFHERNIHSDIALALTNDLRKGLREDLKILIMSATLDTEPLLKLLDAERLRSEGRSWPIEHIYLGGEIASDCVAPMAAAITRATVETTGDILAFLPGVREIERVGAELTQRLTQLQIYPLHGRLKSAEQQLALQKSTRRKLILTTNVAETSLTIDGIETVVDSGLCRQPGFDPASGLTRLATTPISQASSKQRAGRAGRQGPGVCYRLWSEGVQAALLPQTPPEIRSADLTPLALDLCSWGLRDATQLDWLDPPPAGALTASNRLLLQLGLRDRRGRLTADGRRATRLPVHPRFASLLLESERLKALPVGCLLSAFLAEGALASTNRDMDLSEQLHRFAQEVRKHHGSAHPAARAFKQLAGIFDIKLPTASELVSDLLATLIAHAYPDRIACSKQANGDYLLASGRGAKLGLRSYLRNSSWLAVTDISQNDSGSAMIRQALPLNNSWLKQQIDATEWQTEVFWDGPKQRVQGRRVKRLGAIELCGETQIPSPDETLRIICQTIRTSGNVLLNWSKESEQFLNRIGLLHRIFESSWPGIDLPELLLQPEDWLGPFLNGVKTAGQLKKLNLLPALQSLLDWQQTRQLGELAPLRIEVPSGEMMKIDYQADGPTLPVKLQQLFGLAETPAICRGQVPLKLQLLSPAGRPLAVTSDLRNFWNQVYPEVRKEMKGRYPKHPWPDDPWAARPTRKLKKHQV